MYISASERTVNWVTLVLLLVEYLHYSVTVFYTEKCPDGMVNSSCATRCPYTCRQLHQTDEKCVSDKCEIGCACPDGQYEDDEGNCVETCPCYVGNTKLTVGEIYSYNATTCEQW